MSGSICVYYAIYNKKMLTNLAECKKHGGPLTAFDIKCIDDLNYHQVLLETGYLKKTIAPNIKIKRKREII